MADIKYNIDFDLILEVARKGVRRASAFLGLGINAANNPEFKDYGLTDISSIQLIPDNISDESIIHIKEEFSIWVVANGFRELIETFSIFLDQIHYVCAVIEANAKKTPLIEITEKQTNFSNQGFPNKLNMLEASFSVSPTHTDYIKTLNKTRNCLTHRQGIVAKNDCNKENVLSVLWLGAEIYIEEPDGTKHIINGKMDEGIYLEHGGNVNLVMIERNCAYELGSIVKLSPNELAEICWFILREAQYTISSAVEYAGKMGVPIEEPKEQKI